MDSDNTKITLLNPLTIYVNYDVFDTLPTYGLNINEFIKLQELKTTQKDKEVYCATCVEILLKTQNVPKIERYDLIKRMYGNDIISALGKSQYEIIGMPLRETAIEEFRRKLEKDSLPFKLLDVGSYDQRYILSKYKH